MVASADFNPEWSAMEIADLACCIPAGTGERLEAMQNPNMTKAIQYRAALLAWEEGGYEGPEPQLSDFTQASYNSAWGTLDTISNRYSG